MYINVREALAQQEDRHRHALMSGRPLHCRKTHTYINIRKEGTAGGVFRVLTEPQSSAHSFEGSCVH